jgi:flagellar hook-associated protein 1
MSSLFSLLSVARDGMQAQSAGVSVTGQNISNVNTPGYVRRGLQLSARPLGRGNDGGVAITGVSRSFNRFAHSRVVEEHGRRGAAAARSEALASTEATVSPGSRSVADQVNSFFQAFDTLSSAPSDTSARLGVLQHATNLSQQVASTANDLSVQRDGLFTQATGVAGEVNDRLSRIATLNRSIAEATALGDAGADLRDQRDQLVQEVGDRLGARAVEDATGQVTLFSAGTVLVEGGNASSVSVSLDAANNLRLQVQQPGGSTTDATAAMTQGTLGGLREARDIDIPNTQRALDQFAFDLSRAVNTAHSTGFGLDGASGRNLFVAPAVVVGAARAMAVDPALVGQPERVAAAAVAADLPGGSTVAVQIAGLASRALPVGTTTPADRFGTLAADLGTRLQSANAETQLRDDTVQQAETLRESASGVSLDEEMVNLSRFQRAFEASTRVLRVADELLNTLMTALP